MVAYQAQRSMGFSRQEYWSGLPFPSPGDLPNPAIDPRSPALQTDALPSEPYVLMTMILKLTSLSRAGQHYLVSRHLSIYINEIINK